MLIDAYLSLSEFFFRFLNRSFDILTLFFGKTANGERLFFSKEKSEGEYLRDLFRKILDEITRGLNSTRITTKNVDILHFCTIGKISLRWKGEREILLREKRDSEENIRRYNWVVNFVP